MRIPYTKDSFVAKQQEISNESEQKMKSKGVLVSQYKPLEQRD